MGSGRTRNCKECEKIFTVNRDWQIFCTTKCKTRFNKRYREICFYCGERGNHRDHFDPRSLSTKKYFANVEWVYACPECNQTISDNFFSYPHEKIQFLIDRYTQKYDLQKAVVSWDAQELEELGAGLKRRIKKMLSRRRLAEDRVIYLRTVKNYILNDEDC